MLRHLASFALGILLSGPFMNAIAAEMVVVASTSPDINTGYVIEQGGDISIPSGASVTLVSPDGGVVTIEGPYTGFPGNNINTSNETSLISSLSDLLMATEEKTVGLGAMRSTTPEPPYGPWAVNITATGNQCVQMDSQPDLWRPKTSKSTKVIIRNTTNGDEAELRWPSDIRTMKWPSEVKLINGATYSFYLKTLNSMHESSLIFVPDAFPSDPHKAVWMARKGCIEQARLILSILN